MKISFKQTLFSIALVATTVILISATNNQFTTFPQASNSAWKTSGNIGTVPDTITVVGTDSVIYQNLTEIKGGQMSVVCNIVKITDSVTGSIQIEGCNDNTGLSWARIDGIGLVNDTLIFTNAVLVKKNWNIDAKWLKYRMAIRIKNDCKFAAYTNSAWKRYYFNANN